MWTTLNSHADGLRIVMLLAGIGMTVGSRAQQLPPDAPRPAPRREIQRMPAEDSSGYKGTIELTSVQVRPLDETMKRMAGPTLLKEATDPVAIEATTQRALPRIPRNTSAILIINGEKFPDTWAILPNRLLVFLPDRRKLRSVNQVAAAWLGSEQSSMTKRPLTLRIPEAGK